MSNIVHTRSSYLPYACASPNTPLCHKYTDQHCYSITAVVIQSSPLQARLVPCNVMRPLLKSVHLHFAGEAACWESSVCGDGAH